MITGEPFPLGVICYIYYSRFVVSALMAPARLWRMNALWFLDQGIRGRQEKSSSMKFHPQLADRQLSWLAILHKGLVCGLDGYALWNSLFI